MIRPAGFLLLIVGIGGCSESPESPPLVPTTRLEIQKAQDVILAQISPLKIKKNEFVYFIQTQEVYTGQQEPSVSLMEEESLTVTDRIDFTDYVQITIVREVIDHLTEGSPHSKFEGTYYFSTPPSPTSPETLSEENPNIRFYNLKTAEEWIPKPQKVIDKEPCSQPQECLLQVQKVSYDIVFIDPENPQTTKVETWLSSDVPYFATILKSCYTTVISIDSARPLVRQCKTVFDYQ